MAQPDRTRRTTPYSDLPVKQDKFRGWSLLPITYSFVFAMLALVFAASTRADTITGTVKDQSGAVVSAACKEITGTDLTTPIALMSDEAGKFTTPQLSPEKYSVRISKDGFAEIASTVESQGTAQLDLTLAITRQRTSLNVSENSMAFANSDAVYRQLRDVGLRSTFRCENFTLNVDVGTFELNSGTIAFLNLVNRFETGAIFVGPRHFTLKPMGRQDMRELTRRSRSATAEEDFMEAVFHFTGGLYPQFAGVMGTQVDPPAKAGAAFDGGKRKSGTGTRFRKV